VLTSQRKLIAAMLVLAVVCLAIAGIVAERIERAEQLERTTHALQGRAALAASELGDALVGAPDASLHDWVRRVGRVGEMRVTLMDAAGAVVADSGVAPERVPSIENHASRPEVQAALAGEIGSASRRSETVGRPLLYLAQPVPGGVLRVASNLDDVEAAAASLRSRMLYISGSVLLLFIGLAALLSQQSLRAVREMQRAAASIAEGHLEDRLPLDPGDELRGISAAVNQMAEQLRLRLEDATHEKDRLRAVLESMVEGVLVVDPKGSVLLANPRVREIYGVTGEVVGRPLLEVVRDPELDALLHEVASSDETIVRSLATVGDARRSMQVQASRFPPAPGPRAGSVLVLHDVTEIERLEQVRRDFVANASHELRTPLTAIHGFAETLLTSPELSEADRRSYLEVIDRHAKRLANIVNDLLELSTIETGKLRIEPVRIDLAEIVAGVIEDVQPRCVEREIAIDHSVDGDSFAFADPRATEQIVTNLVDNAVKYSEPGGQISVAIEGSGSQVRVSVRDAGIGIPAPDLARIFERFYRVDKARSRALGGTGLGLSIVKHLVQSMGGDISVTSVLGEGSTFAFTLPGKSVVAAVE
jgi:two-component system phosphate regulon sensor histidine kinase PhoR